MVTCYRHSSTVSEFKILQGDKVYIDNGKIAKVPRERYYATKPKKKQKQKTKHTIKIN